MLRDPAFTPGPRGPLSTLRHAAQARDGPPASLPDIDRNPPPWYAECDDVLVNYPPESDNSRIPFGAFRPSCARAGGAGVSGSGQEEFCKKPEVNRSIQSGCAASNVLLDGPKRTATWPSTPPRRMCLAQRHPCWQGLNGRGCGHSAQDGLPVIRDACPARSSSKTRPSERCTHSVSSCGSLERVLEAVSAAGWCSAEASKGPLSRLWHAAVT